MRRQCTTNILPLKFRGTTSKHGIFATLLHHPANTFLPKNLQRWRADDIRPYTVCATELPMQIFRCATEVLRDLLYQGNGQQHFCGCPPWFILRLQESFPLSFYKIYPSCVNANADKTRPRAVKILPAELFNFHKSRLSCPFWDFWQRAGCISRIAVVN